MKDIFLENLALGQTVFGKCVNLFHETNSMNFKHNYCIV